MLYYVHHESLMFSAVIRWSEAECLRQDLPVISENKRSVLGRVLTQIRFPLMTVEEFAQGPAQVSTKLIQ